MITEAQLKDIDKKGFHLKSIAEARRENNKYLKRYGESMWTAAILTAYAGGGWEMLNEFYNMPLKYQRMLLDAYQFVEARRELGMVQAASRPYMKKSDGKKYVSQLTNIINGATGTRAVSDVVKDQIKTGYQVSKKD